ncbi:MAG: serine/threonine-protein kinase [archaeon]|nr:serine/threonine-protein kinase [archaeon]
MEVPGGGCTSLSDVVHDLALAYRTLGNIKVESSDSLTGLQLMYNRTYMFSLSETIPRDAEIYATATTYMPMMASTISFVYDISLSAYQPFINLTREVLVGIYNGNINRWNDPRIQKDNGHILLPNVTIRPLHRTDYSGTSLLVQTLLCSFSYTNKFERWPFCPVISHGGNDWVVPNPMEAGPIDSSGAMRDAISRFPGAIGYLETNAITSTLSSPGNNDLNSASLQNQAGLFVQPTLEALEVAIVATGINPLPPYSYFADLIDLPDCPQCWPGSAYGYIGFRDYFRSNEVIQFDSFSDFIGWYYQGCQAGSVNEVQSVVRDHFAVCPSPRDIRTILDTYKSMQMSGPSPVPLDSPALFAGSITVAFLVVVSGFAAVWVSCRWRMWADIRYDREREKIHLHEVKVQIAEIEEATPEDFQSLLLDEVGITDTGDCVQLLRIIGAGAWSRVYLGEWCGSPVAVKKFYQVPNTEQMRQDFLEETTIMSKLRHPNVVQLLAACSSPEFMLVMEYCPLGSLHTILRSFRQQQSSVLFLTDLRRYLMALDIARGLMYLHTRHPPIIHRDLKPHNILVNDNLVCKVADFGMARSILVENYTRHSTPRGTMAYLSPEVLTQQAWSQKSDVFSLGLCLWELFSAQEIFAGLTTAAIVRGVLNHNLRPDINTVPSELRPIIAQCWSSDPDRRPTSQQAFQFLIRVLSDKRAEKAERAKQSSIAKRKARTISTQDLPLPSDPRFEPSSDTAPSSDAGALSYLEYIEVDHDEYQKPATIKAPL